jgi:threonyl-tRNA synthetase
MRVRAICQNDAHIYTTLDQAESEFLEVLKLHEYYYNQLGLTKNDYYIAFGLPDPAKKDKYHGDKKVWEQAEQIMRRAVERSGITTVDDIGGAAFYGPKTDFTIRSSIGREFAISTNQLDLFMPERFQLEYTAADGSKQRPVVIHRAPLGSHERFIGFLIEHFGGAFPVWLSPVQAVLIPIAEKHNEYSQQVANKLRAVGIRVQVDHKNETMQAKIRNAQSQKVPYMLVVGDKESESNSVSLRIRTGDNIGTLSVEEFAAKAKDIYLTKSLNLW